mmetsp:Transcript_34920/g.94614  ORF Transcript_34920/g.94614 Transcript_34920/m.94614 type:complete len:245 (-) Transcript_34920:253-987(-)
MLLDELVNGKRCVGLWSRSSQRLAEKPWWQVATAQPAIGNGRGADQEHAGVAMLCAPRAEVDDLHLHAVVLPREGCVDLGRGAHRPRLSRRREPEHAHGLGLHAGAGSKGGDDLVHLRTGFHCARVLPLDEPPPQLLPNLVWRPRRCRGCCRCCHTKVRWPPAALDGAVPRVRPIGALASRATSRKGAEGCPLAAQSAQRDPWAVLQRAVLGVRAGRAAAALAARGVIAKGCPTATVRALPWRL